MDVNVTTSIPFQNSVSFSEKSNANIEELQNMVLKNPEIQEKMQKVQEKVMMDLKDVQNFLYMLIGSEIKVESDNNIGSTFNRVA